MAVTFLLSGCGGGLNYLSPLGPTSAGIIVPAPEARWRQPLRVVSFNVAYGREVDRATALLSDHPELADADVILLQEMDGEGVERIARHLGMNWVYHPATRRGEPRNDFGNAILSRWPISDLQKIILPHRSIFGGTIRTATAATLQVGSLQVRVYSVHLATLVNQSHRDRADQMRAILADARLHPRVILGGDLNDGSLGRLAEMRGYWWPTQEGPWTTFFGRVDHILMKGLDPPPTEPAAGTVQLPEGISDHLPVWAVGILR